MHVLTGLFDENGMRPGKRWAAMLFLLVQLAAIAWIVRIYDLESNLHFKEVVLVAIGGFLVHASLSAAWRPIFFLGLSIGGLFWFAGWQNALLVTIIGSLFIAMATLIRKEGVRHWVMLLFTLFLAAVVVITNDKDLLLKIALQVFEEGASRKAAVYGSWLQSHFSVFTILGSMFMYRMLIFLYDSPHMKETPGPARNWSYFFMLPNMGIYLFPPVDYRNFLSRQFDSFDLHIYKKGTQWMALGVFHLVVYRIVYHFIQVPENQVRDLYGFLLYAIPKYMEVIRLSGIFHFSAGILCLFGFNLPKTFDNYYLASGFSDLWRRLNVYFRDFMLKIFYYPIYFRLRGLGNTRAVLLTILLTFLASWMVHSFQMFWLLGKFPIKDVDLIYWNLFGILVATNAWIDLRSRRENKVKGPWETSFVTTAKIMGTFLGMSLLWSLWYSASLTDWMDLVSRAWGGPKEQFLFLSGGLLLVWFLGSLAYRSMSYRNWPSFFEPDPKTPMASFWALLMIAGLLTFKIPAVSETTGRSLGIELDGILTNRLTLADEQAQVEGYYTDILHGNNLTDPMAGMSTARAEQFRNTPGATEIFDFREIIMSANTSYLFKDKPFSINRWGFRDKDYELAPLPGQVRVILLGGSFVSGSGVADAEVFDQLLEEDMNRSETFERYQFLNHGCSSYDFIDCMVHFEKESLWKFEPEYLFFISQGKDLYKNRKDVAVAFQKNIPMPYPYLDEIVRKAGLRQGMDEDQLMKALLPYEEEILQEAHLMLRKTCEEKGITPVWVYWPTVNMRPEFIDEKNKVRSLAEKAGFRIIDLESIYEGLDPESIKVSRRDTHPNARGHAIMARALAGKLRTEFPLSNKDS